MRVARPEDKYLNETFSLDDPELLKVKETLKRHEVDFMSISAHEARILQFLVRGFQIKKAVEIGTLFGYSAICIAKAMPADGLLITLEYDPKHFELAEKMFKDSSVAEKIRSLQGDAVETLKQVAPAGPFDMVFIDANKGAYLEYLEWADANVRPGGLIIGDNTFLWGGVYDQSRNANSSAKQIEVMKEFNRRLSDPRKYSSAMIPTYEGLTVAQKL